MKIQALPLLLSFLILPAAQAQDRTLAATRAKAPEAPRAQTKLLCKTGAEKRAPGQLLKLFFQYNVPFQFEPEDPTVPFGRQVVVLAGRPVMQLFFEKAPIAAGERGEELAPMQCAFAKRPIGPREPSQVQILLPASEVTWMSQTVGQKPGYGPERTLMSPGPGNDWAFTYQHEKVFVVELDDAKDFVTAQKPRPLN